MAYTLADYARLATSPLKAGIVDILRAESPIMDALPFENSDTLDIQILRTKSLPSIGTRRINQSFSASKGATDSITERIVNLGGMIDVDKVLVRAGSVVDQRALQTQLFVKAMALKFNDLFINGNPTTNYDSLTGLRYRLINDLPSTQTVTAGGIDVSPDSSTLSADQVTLIDKIHELLDVCAMKTADFLVMNREMKLRLEAALRGTGLLDTTQDNYGRRFETFGSGGPKILDIGSTDPLDYTQRIIGNTETNDGSATTGGTATSIYAVKVGGGEYVNGFQLYEMDVNDLGLLTDGVTYRTVIDWPMGIYMVNPFSVARLVGVIAA
ncbi:MAG: hypothetical protein D6794_06150 [Deltaproteobacteria bacterium]|nr:MAG: hypothetical protein D6794_06150 [Deltaproteobacteria bacterium]